MIVPFPALPDFEGEELRPPAAWTTGLRRKNRFGIQNRDEAAPYIVWAWIFRSFTSLSYAAPGVLSVIH